MSRPIWWVIVMPLGRVRHATVEPQKVEPWASRYVSWTLCGKFGIVARESDDYPPPCPRCQRAANRRGYVPAPTPSPSGEDEK